MRIARFVSLFAAVAVAVSALTSLSGCCRGAETDEGMRPPPHARPDDSGNVPAKPATTPTAPAAPTAPTARSTAAAARPTPPAAGAETWGEPGIAWREASAGLEEAKRSGKPVVLVLFTTWCPHCKNYSNVFADPRVAEQAKGFVMIRADADKNEALASKYAPDGGYIPRTFFLKPDGSMMADIKAKDGKFQYFFDETRAEPLLAAMDKAKSASRVR